MINLGELITKIQYPMSQSEGFPTEKGKIVIDRNPWNRLNLIFNNIPIIVSNNYMYYRK